MTEELLKLLTWAIQLVIVLGLSAIGYFLKGTLERQRRTEEVLSKNEQRLSIVERDQVTSLRALEKIERELKDDLHALARRHDRMEERGQKQAETMSGILAHLDAISTSVARLEAGQGSQAEMLTRISERLSSLEGAR